MTRKYREIFSIYIEIKNKKNIKKINRFWYLSIKEGEKDCFLHLILFFFYFIMIVS